MYAGIYVIKIRVKKAGKKYSKILTVAIQCVGLLVIMLFLKNVFLY